MSSAPIPAPTSPGLPSNPDGSETLHSHHIFTASSLFSREDSRSRQPPPLTPATLSWPEVMGRREMVIPRLPSHIRFFVYLQ